MCHELPPGLIEPSSKRCVLIMRCKLCLNLMTSMTKPGIHPPGSPSEKSLPFHEMDNHVEPVSDVERLEPDVIVAPKVVWG